MSKAGFVMFIMLFVLGVKIHFSSFFLFQCETHYETIYHTKYEKKCETSYKEHCEEHGYGYHKDYKCYKEPVKHCHEHPVKVSILTESI